MPTNVSLFLRPDCCKNQYVHSNNKFENLHMRKPKTSQFYSLYIATIYGGGKWRGHYRPCCFTGHDE